METVKYGPNNEYTEKVCLEELEAAAQILINYSWEEGKNGIQMSRLQ